MVNPKTVGELIEVLKQFDPNTKLAIQATADDNDTITCVHPKFYKDIPGIPLSLSMSEYFKDDGYSEMLLTISNYSNDNMEVY